MSTLSEQLQSAGYRIVLEQKGWWHCLIDEDGASWNGEGADEERATRAAFQRMVPSRVARECVLAFLDARERAQGRESSVLDEALQPVPVDLCGPPPPVAALVTEEVMATIEPRVEELPVTSPDEWAPEFMACGEGWFDAGAEEGVCTESQSAPRLSDCGDETLAVDSVCVEQPEASASAPPGVDEGPVPRAPLEIGMVLGAVRDLEDEMHAAEEDVGALAPRFMRLMLLHWIARARALEDAMHGDRRVQQRVHLIALQLTAWAKSFWPGSVDALQVEKWPTECWGPLLETAKEQPRSWTDLAACALKEIALLRSKRGVDEDGWADAQALLPRHHNPEAALRDIAARLKNLMHVMDPEGIMEHRRLVIDPTTGKELMDMAKRLRWLRGAVQDTVLWAQSMGHLRLIAWNGVRDLPALRDQLSEDWVPGQGTWAAACGQDPRKKVRQRQRKDFHASRPQAACTDKELQAWVAKGLAVLTAEELLACVEAFKERILKLNDTWLTVRGQRTKLRKVQSAMRTGLDDAMLAADGEGTDEAHELPVEPSCGAVAGASSEALRQRVLPFTRGKRLLLVSNRNDQELAELLCERLEAAEVKLTSIDDHRLQTAAERIRNGSYALVLCATGFISHGAEGVIRDACTSGCIDYVRVGKGRPSTALRCLDRAFNGLEESAAAE